MQYVHVNKSAEEVDLLFRIIDADGNGTIGPSSLVLFFFFFLFLFDEVL